ncbi:MAG: Mur ligase family protein [Gemmatimonadales bacterium]
MTFEEALRFLYPRTGDGGTKWSLGPTRELLSCLGDPQQHYPAIHVGGTNGKGSVCVLLAEALSAAGHRVGLYTSPHLVTVRERMVINGTPISEDAFAMWASQLEGAVVATGASFFEATTAIALADFAARGVDLAVVEVGLGGRLDSTNVVDSLVSAVTGVALEHTDYLGPSLDGIAREKAGIAKSGRPFLIGERDSALVQLMEQVAVDAGAIVRRIPPDEKYAGPLRLRGTHQRRNAAVASHVLRALPPEWRPDDAQMAAGFARAWLPGRLDRRGKWVFDVAHNPSGLSALLAGLQEEPLPRPLHALVGILGDKQWLDMLAAVSGAVDRLWVTLPPSTPPGRAWSLDDVRQSFPNATVESDFAAALEGVQRGGATMLVTGSFHTVGDAMARLPGFAPLG